MQERRITVAGHGGEVELAIAEAGVGGRPLALVHGFTGAKEDFTDHLDRLADLGWHVIAPDQRGHGASAQPADESAYSFDAYATDLLALLDAMGWPSAVVLGHSMGGMVLQTAALRAPERFEALILMDTTHKVVRADEGVIDLAIAIARTEGMAAVMAAQEAAGQADPLANPVHARLVAEKPGYKEFGDRKMLGSSPAMYASMIKQFTDASSGLDRLEQLRSIAVPTLVLVGEHDAPFVKPSIRMAEAIPGAQLATIKGGAHSPQFESPDAWWAALSGFLSTL